VRYIREDRPGLNWARTAGARAAAGDIVAYTDDDVVVDAQWIRTMLVEFAADPEIAAVTGPALALELQSEAQEIFEFRGGFVRGWDRRVYDGVSVSPLFAGMVGAGANVAFRREVLHELRPFSHELDAGTVAESGGDTYAFYLLLSHGRRIAYTPAALVWHRHRRDMPGLARVMHGYSVGGLTMLLRCLVDHRELTALKVAGQWLWRDHVHELARALLRRQTALPGHVVRAYWHGVFVAPGAWWRARRRERQLLAEDRAAGLRDFAPDTRTRAADALGEAATEPASATGRGRGDGDARRRPLADAAR
jgi:cellulose synthase/poly-beta-1,6-N-acetylglucosamine synthase-like glycosyltransferase